MPININQVRYPLHYVASQDISDKKFKKLLKKHKDKVNDPMDFGHTPLHIASQYGNIDVVHELLASGANVNAKLMSGQTALHIASQYGHIYVVNELLASGANVNAQFDLHKAELHNESQNTDIFTLAMEVLAIKTYNIVKIKLRHTPLHIASQYGHIGVVNKLLASGADINAQLDLGETALHIASKNGLLEIVKVLIEADPTILNQTNYHGVTSLNLAAKKGFTEIVTELLSKGADVNIKTNYGHTALHSASEYGHLDVTKEILKAKPIDINSKDQEGTTALHIASVSGHLGIVKELLNYEGIDIEIKTNLVGYTALHLAIMHGHLEIVEELLNRGADANSPDQNGFTSLHYASICNHPSIIKALLIGNADISCVSNNVYTAIEKVFELIIADPSFVDQLPLEQKNKTLSIAISNDNLEVAKILIENGAYIDTKNERGLTPLNLASINGNLEIVEFLVNSLKISDSGLFEQDLELSLFYAAINNHAQIVKFLVNEDVNIYRKFSNKTFLKEDSLTIAVKLDHEAVVEELLKSNKLSRIDLSDILEIAQQKGNQKIIDLLTEKLPEERPSSRIPPSLARRAESRAKSQGLELQP